MSPQKTRIKRGNNNRNNDSAKRDKQQVLIDAVQRLAVTLDRQDALQATIEEAANIVNGEACSVWLTDRIDLDRVVCAQTHAEREGARVVVGRSSYKKGEGLTGWVFATGIALRLDNIADKNELERILSEIRSGGKDIPPSKWENKFGGFDPQDQQGEPRPFLAVPILFAPNPVKVIGVLRVGTTRDRKPFTKEDEDLLTLFAKVLALILSNAQKRDEDELYSSLYQLGAIPEKDAVLKAAVQKFPTLFPNSHCSILLEDADGNYSIKATSNEDLKKRMEAGELKPYKIGEGKTGKAIETGRSVHEVADPGKGLEAAKPLEQCEIPEPANSFIAAPLLDNDSVIGVIRSPRSELPAFTPYHAELLESYAKQISYVLNTIEKHRSELHQKIKNAVAPFLPDADLFDEISQASTPKKKNITLMYLDLKGFTAFSGAALEHNAEQIIDTVNAFFEIAIPFVMRRGGTIDKFTGDGFIALFNAYRECPHHESQAVICAGNIRDAFDTEFKRLFLKRMYEKHGRVLRDEDFKLGLKVGIGIANVIVGPVGIAEGDYQRQDFSFIGQDANFISRLVSGVPEQLAERNLPAERLRKLILCMGPVFDTLKGTIAEAETHIVKIDGAGSGLGKQSEERIVYEILSLHERSSSPDDY